MFRIDIQQDGASDWTDRIAGYPNLSLLQCGEYGDAKAAVDGWRVERGLIASDTGEPAPFQALIRNLPGLGGGLVWLNRAPLLAADADGPALDGVLGALRRHYVDGQGFYLRVAPALPSLDPASPAPAPTGFDPAGAAGWASAALDLAPDADALRASLRRNWRSHLNKSERADLAVASGAEGQPFDDFLAGFRRFIGDQGIATSVTPGLIGELQARLPAGRKLQAYVAERDGEPLAGVLIARYGPTAEYLAAYSSHPGRKLGAGQNLLWRAIVDAKAAGARRFDMGGMDPDQTPEGIFKFKDGVRPVPYRLMAEVEASNGGWLSRLVRWRVRRARAGN
ncbi:MAG: GNAT family N-acetyltransferase [Magnetovibrio sp.]|nr:GNAT family N-acetyltransferase [Magnetovibrio sp.]